MSDDPTTTTPTPVPAEAGTGSEQLATVTEDLLVEDVSIDGMCGVY